MAGITAMDAAQANLKFYFTGKPCSRGHVAQRYVSTGNCVECQKSYSLHRRSRGLLHEFTRLGLRAVNVWVHPDDLAMVEALVIALQNERLFPK